MAATPRTARSNLAAVDVVTAYPVSDAGGVGSTEITHADGHRHFRFET